MNTNDDFEYTLILQRLKQNNDRHYRIIVDRIGNNLLVVIPLTHASRSNYRLDKRTGRPKSRRNIRLDFNPLKNDGTNSYIRPHGEIRETWEFEDRYKIGHFSEKDYFKIMEIAQKRRENFIKSHK